MKRYNLELTENDAIVLVTFLGVTAKMLKKKPVPDEVVEILKEHPERTMLRLKARIEGQRKLAGQSIMSKITTVEADNRRTSIYRDGKYIALVDDPADVPAIVAALSEKPLDERIEVSDDGDDYFSYSVKRKSRKGSILICMVHPPLKIGYSIPMSFVQVFSNPINASDPDFHLYMEALQHAHDTAQELQRKFDASNKHRSTEHSSNSQTVEKQEDNQNNA